MLAQIREERDYPPKVWDLSKESQQEQKSVYGTEFSSSGLRRMEPIVRFGEFIHMTALS